MTPIAKSAFRQLPRAIGLLLAGAFVATPAAEAQATFTSRAVEITVTGRVHSQFNTSSVSGAFGSEFLVRRARLTAEIDVNDVVSGKVQPDYGEGGISLKDAYVRLAFDPALRVTAGQFKRPFDLFELTSSTQILVVERAGGIRGVGTCAGPGGLCSLSRFTEKLGYSDRDIGIQVDGRSSSGRVAYYAAITNGAGANTEDENGAKSYTGRVSVQAANDVTIAGNVAVHDYVDQVTADDEYATAFGADVEIGNYDQGLHIQAGAVFGDNWLNPVNGSPSSFATAQGIVTYKVPVTGNRFVEAVEPLGRVSWGDPDTDVSDDEGILLTPGFVVYFTGRNKVAANVDIWSPTTGDTEWSLKIQSYLHF